MRPETGLARAWARALHQIGWLEPAGAGSYRLTPVGTDVAVNRGFVRVVTRGWEPTFRAIGAAAAHADFLRARTDPDATQSPTTQAPQRAPGRLATGPVVIASGLFAERDGRWWVSDIAGRADGWHSADDRPPWLIGASDCGSVLAWAGTRPSAISSR